MEPDRWRDRPIPPPLHAAIGRGWRGVAVADAAPGDPVRLVCAVPGARIASLAPRGLAVGLPTPSRAGRPGGPRRVALALSGDPAMVTMVDLGFADARALVARLGADGALGLVWVRAEDGVPVRTDVVGLSAALADRLRTEAAREGEWCAADPAPEGFSADEWVRVCASTEGACLARGDGGDGDVVVVAHTPPPLGAEEPPAELRPPDIELTFAGGPPIPEAASSIRLHLDRPGQRALAARLCRQAEVRILMVDRAGRWLAQVDLALGTDTRELIAAALRSRAA